MKVAILTPTFHAFSGIDRVVQLQAEKLAKEGHKVTVIALDSSLRQKGYRIISLGMPSSAFWGRLYRLFFFLDRNKLDAYRMLKGYDRVIAHFYPMTWLAYEAKKHFGIHYVYWDHGINTTGLLDSFSQKAYMLLFRALNNYTIKTADEACSVSKYLSSQLWKESGIRSKVVYNTIDKARFNKNASPGSIRKRYGLGNKRVVLYVGRIAPHKGVHHLIEAMRKVQERVPGSVLLVVGKETFPGYAEKLRETAGKYGMKDIVFTGFVDDKELPSFYATCDAYATCSQWEGFNLPASEAQACGKPVVAFDICSHPEIVKKGALVRNKDIDGFADALVNILSRKE